MSTTTIEDLKKCFDLLDTLIKEAKRIQGDNIDSAKKKSHMHTYVVTYEDLCGRIFDDFFDTEADTVEEAEEEYYLDNGVDFTILSIEKVN